MHRGRHADVKARSRTVDCVPCPFRSISPSVRVGSPAPSEIAGLTWATAPSAGPAFRGTSVQFLSLPVFGRIDVRVRARPCAGYIHVQARPTGPRTSLSSSHSLSPLSPPLASAHAHPSRCEHQP